MNDPYGYGRCMAPSPKMRQWCVLAQGHGGNFHANGCTIYAYRWERPRKEPVKYSEQTASTPARHEQKP